MLTYSCPSADRSPSLATTLSNSDTVSRTVPVRPSLEYRGIDALICCPLNLAAVQVDFDAG